MGRDSTGAWTRQFTWVTDKNNSVKITASRFDTENDDFASGLSASAETTKVADGDYQYLASITGNTSQNSISASIAIAYTSYGTGQLNWFLPTWNNTGSTTMTISGLSAASMQAGGAALSSGMLLSGIPAMVISDGSGHHLMNPQRAPANFNGAGSYGASSIATADIQDRAVTLAKLDSGTTHGGIITHGASGVAEYLGPGTTGLPLVTKGVSANAVYEALAPVGLASNSVETAKINDRAVTLAKMDNTSVQGSIYTTTASGVAAYVVAGASGLPLVTLGASVNAVFQALGVAGLKTALFEDLTSAAPADGDFIAFGDVNDNNNLKRTTKDQITGSAGGFTLGTPQATTSGTSFDFGSLPAGLTRINVNLTGVSLDGTQHFAIQLGDAGGLETSGYISSSGTMTNASSTGVANKTDSFIIRGGAIGDIMTGTVHLSLENASTNTWVASHSFKNTTVDVTVGGGSKSLDAELTQVTLLDSGSDNFDAGAVNISYA